GRTVGQEYCPPAARMAYRTRRSSSAYATRTKILASRCIVSDRTCNRGRHLCVGATSIAQTTTYICIDSADKRGGADPTQHSINCGPAIHKSEWRPESGIFQ